MPDKNTAAPAPEPTPPVSVTPPPPTPAEETVEMRPDATGAPLSARPAAAAPKVEATTDADTLAEREMRRKSRRSFLQAGIVVAGVGGGLVAFNKWAGKEENQNNALATPFRRALAFNDVVAQRLFFSPRHQAHEFDLSDAREPRNNYKGETPIVDLPSWRLTVDGIDGGAKQIPLQEIQALEKVSQTTELKCVEGWSTVVNWAGARFIDFAKKFPPPPGTRFVAMLSEPADYPDERYYVGLDLASCLHPQTLLAYEMNGKPLTAEHGAPLRLVMPHKYGIKQIKLITTIAYRPDQPDDYWFENGYDYYAGL